MLFERLSFHSPEKSGVEAAEAAVTKNNGTRKRSDVG